MKEGKALEQKQKEEFSYQHYWEELQKKKDQEKDWAKEKLKVQVWNLEHVPVYVKQELMKLVEFGAIREDILQEMKKHRKNIEDNWPAELKEVVLKKMCE